MTVILSPHNMRITATKSFKVDFDYDLNKRVLDKIPKVKSYSLGDIYSEKFNDTCYKPTGTRSNAWFIPRDNDWED